MNRAKSSRESANQELTARMIWDLPVRIFHWSLAVLFFVAWMTSEGDQWLNIHLFAGYAILGLVLFRILWGLTGSHFARFKQFSFTFSEARDYAISVLNGVPKRFIGHNPAGSWAIYLLLLGLVIVVATGFFAFGGEEGHGLAGSLFSYGLGWWARNIHDGIASLMMGLVVIHVIGVIIESRHHNENLVMSMLHGRKATTVATPAVKSHRAVASVLVLLLFGYVLSAGLGIIPGKEWFNSQFTGNQLATLDVWQEECGGCHMAYHPSLLTERSWNKLLQQQHQHFGEDLYLDEATQKQLSHYATANSAEQGETEPARKIVSWSKPSLTPLRITETRYWQHKHEEIDPEVWKQSNVNGKTQCDSCHSDAKQGWFEDSKMSVPDVMASN